MSQRLTEAEPDIKRLQVDLSFIVIKHRIKLKIADTHTHSGCTLTCSGGLTPALSRGSKAEPAVCLTAP